MKRVTIFLRAIQRNGKNHLALFDSNQQGDIDNLITDVPAGYSVIWRLDSNSGITNITKVYSNEDVHKVFVTEPRKRLFCKGFKMKISKDTKKGEEEKYSIACILSDGSELNIDPVIRVLPPPKRK
jgi:hypothetical protein